MDDADTDYACADTDNCPLITNVDQADTDGDNVGNVCDGCPNDSAKIDPGTCGCGISEAACNCDWGAAIDALANGDFETWSADDPVGWGVDESGGPISQETVPPHVFGGSSSAQFDRTAAGILRVSQSGLQFEPGKWYRIRWHAKSSDPAAVLVWRLSNNTEVSSVASNGTTWWSGWASNGWTVGNSWETVTQWIQIDPAFAATDGYGLVFRWNAGTAGETLHLDEISIVGPFDAQCVN